MNKVVDNVPKAEYGLIGGSGTWGMRFPEDLDREDVELIEVFEQGFDTPYGRSIALKLLRIAGKPVLRVAMHGVHYDEQHRTPGAPWVAAKQVAAVFQAAGVRWALVEGSVGGIQNPDRPGEPLPPWSVTVTDDYMMLWRPPDNHPFAASRKRVARHREPFCAALRRALRQAAAREPRFTLYDHGVYVCAPVGRFETSAEIESFARLGAHVVGMTLGHEAPLMRQLGIHFASLNIVSNHAEGRVDGWVGNDAGGMGDFYFECAPVVGHVMVDALKQVIQHGPGACNCADYYLDRLNAFPVPGA
jgi:5'-methylthioadenosine phosphorylase